MSLADEQLQQWVNGIRKTELKKHDSLPVAIDKVLKDQNINDKTKLERIKDYIQVYFENEDYERYRDMF